jgi:hypothetical protein
MEPTRAIGRPAARAALFSILTILGAASSAQAQNVTLAWDAPPGFAATGYTLHVGVQSGVYGQTIDVGAPTTYTFTQAQPGTRYCCAESAYNASNVSTPLSNEITWKINVGPALVQPLNQVSTAGSSTSLQLSATDDGDPLTYTASGLPAGVSINPMTGRISGTPTTAGSRTVTVSVSDGQLSASRTFTWVVNGPFALTGLTSNLASPLATGTSITFAASAAGGTAPYQYKFWLYNGSSWTLVRDWSTTATYAWTPTAANSNYRIGVWGRDATVSSDSSAQNLGIPFVITGPSSAPPPPPPPPPLPTPPLAPLAITSLTSNLASPRVAGTSITFTTTASGGNAPYQYKWWVYNGSSWTIVNNWSGSNTYTWTPTQTSLYYRVGVWVRNATTTADVSDANLSVAYPITASGLGAPMTITSLSSNLVSPQTTGTTITFTAAATGGAAPYQFKWWVYDGRAWTIVQNWNGSASYTWTPTQANANYRVGVWVRSATTSADVSDANLAMPFAVLTPGGSLPLHISALTSSMSSPQRVGTTVTFTAVPSGGSGGYHYKWWVFDGARWLEQGTWTTSATFTWTPMQARAEFRIGVWVRPASSTLDDGSVNLSMAFPTVP